MTRRARRMRVFGILGLCLMVLTSAGTLVTSASAVTSRWVLMKYYRFDHPLSQDWFVYNAGQKSAANVTVANGMLNVLTVRQPDGTFTSGGVSNVRGLEQTYGRYVFRMRIDKSPGTRANALTWPTGGHWPPEDDIAEVSGRYGDRDYFHVSNHYGSDGDGLMYQQKTGYRADLTKWHVFTYVWRPAYVRFKIDSHIIATFSGHSPDMPMWMAFQTLAGGYGADPGADTPDSSGMHIDWLREYALS